MPVRAHNGQRPYLLIKRVWLSFEYPDRQGTGFFMDQHAYTLPLSLRVGRPASREVRPQVYTRTCSRHFKGEKFPAGTAVRC